MNISGWCIMYVRTDMVTTIIISQQENTFLQLLKAKGLKMYSINSAMKVDGELFTFLLDYPKEQSVLSALWVYPKLR